MGTAQSCGKVTEGSGSVFGNRRVMTNAHVVGGVDEPTVQIGGEGRKYDAKVVLYDWERDIAVLDVPNLDAPALQFTAKDATSGNNAIVAGFPQNGAYDVQPARVRGRITANGPGRLPTAEPCAATSTRSTRPCARATRAVRCSRPTARCTEWSVKSLDDADAGYALTADEVQPDATKGRAADGGWTATAARSGAKGDGPLSTRRVTSAGVGLGLVGGAADPETRRAGSTKCTDAGLRCRAGNCGGPSDGSSGPSPSGGCVVRHCSRRPSPYLDVCPCPKVDNLAQAPNWPMREAFGCS